MIKLLSVADIITIMNATLGFLAILMIFSNQFQLAASFILLGLLADGLDGIVARRIGNGQMGEYLETIADVLSLSAAPLILLYKINYEKLIVHQWLQIVFVVVLIFNLICSLLRLSSFSVMKNRKYFVGLATSASAIFLVLVSFLNIDPIYLIPFIALFGCLMISPIRFPKHGLKIDIVATVFIVAVIILNTMYNNIALYLLLGALIVYVIGGPLYLKIKKDQPNGT